MQLISSSDLIYLFVAIFFAALALGEIVRPGRRKFVVTLLTQAICFVVLSWTLARLDGSPLSPEFAGPWSERLFEQILEAIWWLVAARLIVITTRLLLARQARPEQSRILLDIFAGAIYVSAALAIVAVVLGIPVRGLLATSGIIAIVLGLALQSTLGDLFSGIAVGVERPYRPGDHLSIDGGVSGRVVQVNWRSTHIIANSNLVVVPNSIVAKSRLVNHSQPTSLSTQVLEFDIHPDVPPPTVISALQAALLSCEMVASDLPVAALCSGLSGDSATYTVNFAAPRYEDASLVRSEVITQVSRHLFHAGIPLAIAGKPPSSDWSPRMLSAEALLARSDLFAGVSERNRAVLASHLEPIELDSGEVLFQQGSRPDAMYMIATGTLEVFTGNQDVARRYLLAPGESVGLAALVTGDPYRTTATALNQVRAFRLGSDGLAAALASAPDLTNDLEDAVRRALAIMSRFDAGEDPQIGRRPVAILQRLRKFLQTIS